MTSHKKTAQLPKIIYGTAWKEDTTKALVKKAVSLGYRAIDTANQTKHYWEDFAGEALLECFQEGIAREEFFLQSKYTYAAGQDHRLPYDPKSSFTRQVEDSFANTLRNLHTDYLDSYLLHGPSHPQGLTESDLEVWRAMETLRQSGLTKRIGVSNVGLHHLEALCEKARLKPEIVQNRCYAVRGWDQDVREYCRDHHIVYEGFSLLTANPRVVRHSRVCALAKKRGVTPEQVVLRFASQIGILPLTGTTDPDHMREDLEIFKFELAASELEELLRL